MSIYSHKEAQRGPLIRDGQASQIMFLKAVLYTKSKAFPSLHSTALGRKSLCV